MRTIPPAQNATSDARHGAQKIRLLVAEDNARLRDALQLLLADQDGFLYVASTSSAQEIVPLCKRHEVGGGGPGYRFAWRVESGQASR